jgi:hypothetical protein
VRIGLWIGWALLVAAAAPSLGCAHGPRRFGKIQHPAPLVRARAIELASSQPDARAVPALVGRLGDEDPVVRLAAHEELRRRTGRDFGYVAWASPEERSSAIDRWRSWLGQARGGGAAGPGTFPSEQIKSPASPPIKTLPGGGQSDP